MADRKQAIGWGGVYRNLKDMSDGSHAEVVSAVLQDASGNALGKAEDAAHASGDTGVMILAVRKDTATALAGTDGDYIPLIVDSSGRVHVAPLVAGEAHIGEVGGRIATPSANFTRPSDTTAYASGDLVANSTTAGSVVSLSWTITRIATGSAILRRVRLRKSGTGVTNAQFRVHFYSAAPTAANGDNGVWSTSGVADYLGAVDVTVDRAFTDGAAGNGVPVTGSEINIALASGSTIRGLVEARGAYTPASAEVFTIDLEVYQN